MCGTASTREVGERTTEDLRTHQGLARSHMPPVTSPACAPRAHAALRAVSAHTAPGP